MERFLSECAKYIYKKHVDELHEICLVFPNRRAGVFLTSYLQNEINGAVIGPQTTTIAQLISENSDWHLAEKLHLISILYDVFRKHTQTTETFDEFYFWGEVLLADFNDIDRYLVNAKDLFRNISDLKEIESVFDYLSPEQKQALEYFWGSVVVSDKKEFQYKHVRIWEKLYPVYKEFKEVLREKNLAYAGMIDRQVVEHKDIGIADLTFKKYYIIGLNALNACERKFFTRLQKIEKVEFLWDFDIFYQDDERNEAGRFMRNNIKQFPPPFDFFFNKNIFNKKKKVNLVAVSSVYGQSQQIPYFLEETKKNYKPQFDNTAIVLADESLLFSTLGVIPSDIGAVNVTMGYPVKNSMIYGFLMLLANLVKNVRFDNKKGAVAYHRYVSDILNHQLLANWENDKVSDFLKLVQKKNEITIALSEVKFDAIHQLIFSVPEKVENFSDYFLQVLGEVYQKLKTSESENKMLLEIIYAVYQSVEKLNSVIKNVVQEQKREISNPIYFRLFSQYLGSVSVAFEGEPLSGIQVMGILETRCLDFKNLIILGLNENKWPRTFTAPSFIPANIRKGFGLPGIDEQDAMYAYYFYRLIQRAENITATYSVLKEGINTGELSRYGYQLQYDSAHKPENINLDFHFANEHPKSISIQSSASTVHKLLERNTEKHPLSPSAINTYLQCSLRFYFRYLADLPEPDEIKEEIDGMIFGNIFHDTVEAIYQPFTEKVVTRTDIENIQKNKVLIENEIRKKIAKNYFNQEEDNKEPVLLEGKSILIYENVKTYLNQLFKLDINITPFTLYHLEKKTISKIKVDLEGKQKEVFIGGTIDRIDSVDGKIRVLDYKTGNVQSKSFYEPSELFEKNVKKPKKEVLQALVYSWLLSENSDNEEFRPVIYSLREFFAHSFNPAIKWNKREFSFDEIKDEFFENLKLLVTEIYSSENEFTQTPFIEHCEYCAYREICQRFKM